MTQKAVYKSKVFWANVVALILAVLGTMTGVIPVEYMAYFTVALAILNLILRYLTDQPIGLKDIKPIIDAAKELKTERVK